jgi:hypothetical protein
MSDQKILAICLELANLAFLSIIGLEFSSH